MGTQQILLIVLSVIIVGVAIAVGITMFSNQAYNANQSAVAGECQNYGAQVMQWWKTPTAQGGAGQTASLLSTTTIGTFIGIGTASDNGTFQVTTAAGDSVIINGLGTELRNSNKPLIRTKVTLSTGAITSSVGSGTTLP